MNFKSVFSYLKDRSKEPSTAAAVAAVAAMFGTQVDPGTVQDVMAGVSAVAAIAATLRKG